MEQFEEYSQEPDIQESPPTSTKSITNANAESFITEESTKDTGGSYVASVKQECTDQDMVNMFASVWVKVEVNEVEEETNNLSMEVVPEKDPFKKRRIRNRKIKYNCSQCDYATPYKNCLQIHVDGHNGTKHNCTLCDYITKFPSSLRRHMIIKHQQKNTAAMFKCEHCDYTTFYKCNLYSHTQRHLNNKQFECPHCDYATCFRQHLTKHVKRHNKDDKDNNMLYKCDQCPFVTRFEGHISRHLAKIHNIVSDKANRCDYCDFSTRLNWRLTIHKTRSKQEEILKCSVCGFETYYMCQSKIHKRMHYKDLYKGKTVQNDLPNENESSQVEENESEQNIKASELIEQIDGIETNDRRESEVNESTENYRLDPNGVNWNSIDVLNTDDKEKPFKCYMCSYAARYKASVQRHYQRRHTLPESRPYKCLNCDFSTKTKDQIALHNKRSQSNTLISCPKCNFITKFKCQFVMHQKTHYDHECPNCDFKCRNKYDMQKHFSIVHLGDGMKCKYCDYQATRKESLLSHEATHTGCKPFKCNHCDYNSVRKSLLRNHMRRFHADVVDDVTYVSDNKIQSLKFPMAAILQDFQAFHNPRDN